MKSLGKEKAGWTTLLESGDSIIWRTGTKWPRSAGAGQGGPASAACRWELGAGGGLLASLSFLAG